MVWQAVWALWQSSFLVRLDHIYVHFKHGNEDNWDSRKLHGFKQNGCETSNDVYAQETIIWMDVKRQSPIVQLQ